MAERPRTSSKRTVLITGCSDGGLGAALSRAFHDAGFHVYATARNPAKMKDLEAYGIETLMLDVLSPSSIAACAGRLTDLDILVNNAGATCSMPVSDLALAEAKELFELNVWSCLAVTQAFLPLLRKSKGMIVNHSSIASVAAVPFHSAYNASKAAIAMFSASMRLELAPFGITVVDLKSGTVKSNINQNQQHHRTVTLPQGSLYEPAKEPVERAMRGDIFDQSSIPAATWAQGVVADLTKKTPPPIIWRGGQAFMVWLASFLPFGTIDASMKKMTGLDVLERALRS